MLTDKGTLLRTILWHGKPVAFYPYTSIVQDRIIDDSIHYLNRQEADAFSAEYQQMEKDLITKFQKAGIDARLDNKIVFEVEIHGRRLFIGFKDWTFSVGFGVSHDAWLKPVLPKTV